MDSLLNDIRDLNDSMQTQNKKAKTSNTINRAAAAAGGQQNARQNNTNSTNTNNDKGIVDITEALRSYKLRSEIERAFFFHLFYEILRQQFGLKGTQKEKDIFERKGGQVDISSIINSRDIKAVIEGREAYENATQEQRKKWIRQREQRIVYHAGANFNQSDAMDDPQV